MPIRFVKKDIQKDVKLFYLLGAYKGDGNYLSGNSYSIRINLVDLDFLEEIKKQWKEVFNWDTKIRPLKVYGENSQPQNTISFSCKDFFEKGLNLLLPKTREEKIEYLKGLWDAEGCISIYNREVIRGEKKYNGKDKCLSIAQKDTKNLDLWYSWMQELGIDMKKNYRNDGRSDLRTKKNSSIKKFAEIIGFRIKRKQDKLNKAIEIMHKSKLEDSDKKRLIEMYKQGLSARKIGKIFDRNKGAILSMLRRRQIKIRGEFKTNPPFTQQQKQQIIKIYTTTNLSSRDLARIFKRHKTTILNLFKVKKIKAKPNVQTRITAEDIDKLEIILCRDLYDDIPDNRKKKYASKGLESSKIKSIKLHSRCKGYDLHTPKYNNFFLSNGILSHNSFLAAQIGQYWTSEIKRKYGITVPYNLKQNYVFDGVKLIEKGNALGQKHKYSALVFDEAGADLEGTKSMLATTRAVKDYLRECGQYNMLTILVLPEFFDLPKGIALSRSACMINVYYIPDEDGFFQRGYFKFFNRPAKKMLYLRGKKELNYNAWKQNFYGDFPNFLPFNVEEYSIAKKDALKKRESTTMDKKMLQRNISWSILVDEFGMSQADIARKMTNYGASTVFQTVSEALKGFDIHKIALENIQKRQLKKEIESLKLDSEPTNSNLQTTN